MLIKQNKFTETPTKEQDNLDKQGEKGEGFIDVQINRW